MTEKHKYFKIDTATDIGHITIRNIDGENMSFIEIEEYKKLEMELGE